MTDAAIFVENLSKRFGDIVGLDGIDLEVPAGTVFGLLGPNGAGKTTTVRVLSTIIHPDGGRAEVLGYDVVKEADAVRRRVGMAGQYAAVDPNLTGRENLRMVGILCQLKRPAIDPRADELLSAFGLQHAADRPARTYSGGMRRRLDIAAALVPKPPVLFLDEPTTGLDLSSRNDLWDMIRALVADGTTVLLTTQYLEEADQLADRVAVVDGGKIIANDTPANLKSQLGDTVVELGFADEALAVRADGLLADGIPGTVEREGTLLRISSDRGPHVLVDVLRRFDADGLEPGTLAVREPSLDDVFLSLTGRHAEPAADEERPSEAGAA